MSQPLFSIEDIARRTRRSHTTIRSVIAGFGIKPCYERAGRTYFGEVRTKLLESFLRDWLISREWSHLEAIQEEGPDRIESQHEANRFKKSAEATLAQLSK